MVLNEKLTIEITGIEIAWAKGKNTKSSFKTLKEVQTMNKQDFKLKELEEVKVQQLARERQEIFELEEKVKKGMDQINRVNRKIYGPG